MTRNERFQRLFAEPAADATLKQQAIRGGGYYMTAEAIDFVLRVVSIMVLARLLLPEHFGLLGMVTAITALAERFKEMGLQIATVQRPSITHEQVSNLFWANAGLGITTGMVVAALAWPIARFYADDRLIPITLAIALTFVWGGFAVQHQALLRRALKFRAMAFIHVGSSAVSIVVAIALALNGFDYWALVVREVVRSACSAVGTWASCRWIPGPPTRSTGVRSMLGFGGYLTVVHLASVFSTSFGHILMGRLFGAHPLGMYRQGFQLVLGPIAQLTDPIGSVAESTLSRLQSDPETYRRYYRKLVTLVAGITMPAVVFILIHADEVVRVVLGPGWEEATPIFRLLALASLLMPAVGTTNNVMVTCGLGKRYLWLGLLNASVLVAFSVIGSAWGPSGIAAAHLCTVLVMLTPRLHWGLRGTPVSPATFLAALRRPLIASLAMAATLLLVESTGFAPNAIATLVAGAVVGAVAYGAAWLLLPGGRTEVLGLVEDVRSSLGR